MLPDDTDEIAKYLRLLAGDSGGPDGASIYVDGFLTNRPPPKTSIAEVRIDNNPFSSEYEKNGSGAINIFTKISSRKLSGSFNTSFNDESFNARNPFALIRAPSQLQIYGARLSGPFFNKKTAYSFNVTKLKFGNTQNINASIVDNNFKIVPLRENYSVPLNRLIINGNLDFQLKENKTLRFSYERYKNSGINQGIGDLTLFSSGRKTASTDSTFRMSQTYVIKNKIINEFRFQFQNTENQSEGVSNSPRTVTDTFISGNSLGGRRNQLNKNIEIANVLTFEVKSFTIRVGGTVRIKKITDYSPDNFRGTYFYNGGIGPKLNNNNLVIGSSGEPVTEFISGIERYRRTILFASQGLTPQQIRTLGGGVSQFSVNIGDPSIKLNQTEFGSFIYNTWKIRSNFSFGAGARIDSQTNLGRNIDVSPRLAIAWAPFKKDKVTAIRGGIGWYYSRVPLSLRLQPEKIKQNKIQSYLTDDPTIIDNLGNPMEIGNSGLSANSKLHMIFSPNLRSAYFFQAAISLEQELPKKWKFTSTFTENKGRKLLRSINIGNRIYGNVYQFESSGIFNAHTLTPRISKKFKNHSLFVNYRLGFSKSDTDSPQTFPMNQFNFSNEYGFSSVDNRQQIYFGGYITAPFNLSKHFYSLRNSI